MATEEREMIDLQEPYDPRPIRFLELWETGGWRMKVYGVAYRSGRPSEELVRAAKDVAEQRLPQSAEGEGRYGVGFLGVHAGRGANFVFVDWWANENELHHHVYHSSEERPTELEYAASTAPSACVWDLFVMCFERDAWLDEVLANPGGPNLDGYLHRRFDGDV
jgi:hypothetical protein